ncbi:hypothetical protein [Oligoflexus tunisiensis]|uniref:hypothetical protein n=1 Tax=Oligoflexus tunisiensis TaxID=708132 RepID=UPI00114CF76C|nr:hypothetical protein [Oligoflexus tunisiensis]
MTNDRRNRFNNDNEGDSGFKDAPVPNSEDMFETNNADFEEDTSNLIDFFKYPKEKRKIAEFVEKTYKEYERESVERQVSRVENERKSNVEGETPYYKPGHIGSLVYEYMNMVGVESSFVSGLQHTKSSLTKSIQQRVDEINTLLRGVGGFNRQIKPSFSRCSVIYLEQEDPRNHHRERVIFTINIADFELHLAMDGGAKTEVLEDGRTLQRWVWDDAVNNLSTIVSNTGLKPKYVKNDKETCHLSMRQYLVPRNKKTPDEFFEFDLKYCDEDTRKKLKEDFKKEAGSYETRIKKLEKKIYGRFTKERTREDLSAELIRVKKDYEFFLATHPDPDQMDTGLIFSIHSNTMKDYSLTKDKMQVIMTKFILSVSRIAEDRSMDKQLSNLPTQRSKYRDSLNEESA